MTQKGKSVTLTLYSSPEGRYHWGGGCPYGQPLWGVKVRRLWCLGSEGSACLWQAGSKGGGIALRAMKFYDSASQNGKPQNLASLVEMHPYRWLAPPLPPEGEVPPQAGIGVHFHRRKGGLPVFFRP